MKLMLKEYLENIGEREGLDTLLGNLLSQMGLNVLTSPMRGTKQHGVDIAAVGRLDSDQENTVYLFSIKSGDITRKNWDIGPQALRPSIGEIVDGYVKGSILPQYANYPIVIYVCCGGKVQENICDVVSGFLEQTQQRDASGRLRLRVMNGDEIANCIVKHFMSPKLVSINERSLLFRCLSMAEEPDSSYLYFTRLLHSLLREEKTEKKKIFRVRQLSLCIGLLQHHCIEAKNLDACYRAAETSLLHCWHYLNLRMCTAKRQMKKQWKVFSRLWWQYIGIGQLYREKISVVCHDAYFMTYACHAGNEVDVNLRLYDVMGRLASYGASLWWYALSLRECPDLLEVCHKEVEKVCNALVGLLKNNPVANSPIRDDYAVEIGIVSIFFNQIKWFCELHEWYLRVLDQTGKNFCLKGAYPSTGLDYPGLMEHLQHGHDEDYKNKVLPSSELFPVMYMFASALGFSDVCTQISQIVETFLKNCDFQVWYPEAMSEEVFYTNARIHGLQLVSQNLLDGSKFVKNVFSECEKRELPFSCLKGSFGGLLLIGCRLYRYPLPPHFVFAIAKSRKSKDAHDQDEDKNHEPSH